MTDMEYELYHYGVPGMKWGVRKAREIRIGQLKQKKRRQKLDYLAGEFQNQIRPEKHHGDKLRTSRENQKTYRTNSRKTEYRIAKQKAKIDPAYKDSKEYKAAKRRYNEQVTMNALDSLLKSSQTTT